MSKKDKIGKPVTIDLRHVLTWRGKSLRESFDKFKDGGEEWTQDELRTGEHIGVRQLTVGNCLITALTRTIESDKDENKNNQKSTVRRVLEADRIGDILDDEDGAGQYVLSGEWVQICRSRTWKNGSGDIIYFAITRIIDPGFLLTEKETEALQQEAAAALLEARKDDNEGE